MGGVALVVLDLPCLVQAAESSTTTEAEDLARALALYTLPSFAAYVRRLYAHIDPRLVVTVGMVVVPEPETGWEPFAVGLPPEREAALLPSLKAEIARVRAASIPPDSSKAALGSRLSPSSAMAAAAELLRRRNEDLDLDDVESSWFVSPPSPRARFSVVYVLGASTAALSRIPSLFDGEAARRVSLASRAIDVLLRAAATETGGGAESPLHFAPREDIEDLLRAAGDALILTALGDRGRQRGRELNLFERINRIAAVRYEKNEGKGRMVFSQRLADTSSYVPFERAVPLSDFVWSRKMLEICTDDVAVGASDSLLLGLVDASLTARAFWVEFVSTTTWRFRFGDSDVLMEVVRGIPRVPQPTMDRASSEETVQRVFGGLEVNVDLLWETLYIAREHGHATTLVVTPDAASEAHRLRQQATPIAPTVLSETQVRAVTRIDGAVLLDQEGLCHAVGVILDGKATDRGSPARGARFNSALRYVLEEGTRGAIAVVLSEDGNVDLLPRLRPSIKRSALRTMNQMVREHEEGAPSQALRLKCARLVQLYPELIEEDVRERAFQIAFSTIEELGDVVVAAFDPHPTDVTED
jgi:hypothetical protein